MEAIINGFNWRSRNAALVWEHGLGLQPPALVQPSTGPMGCAGGDGEGGPNGLVGPTVVFPFGILETASCPFC